MGKLSKERKADLSGIAYMARSIEKELAGRVIAPGQWVVEFDTERVEDLQVGDPLLAYVGGGLRLEVTLHGDPEAILRIWAWRLRKGDQVLFDEAGAEEWNLGRRMEEIYQKVVAEWGAGPLEGIIAADALRELIETNSHSLNFMALHYKDLVDPDEDDALTSIGDPNNILQSLRFVYEPGALDSLSKKELRLYNNRKDFLNGKYTPPPNYIARICGGLSAVLFASAFIFANSDLFRAAFWLLMPAVGAVIGNFLAKRVFEQKIKPEMEEMFEEKADSALEADDWPE